jgi:hypothetical protein
MLLKLHQHNGLIASPAVDFEEMPRAYATTATVIVRRREDFREQDGTNYG